MSRFKVGDPVWHIGRFTGTWRAAVVASDLTEKVVKGTFTGMFHLGMYHRLDYLEMFLSKERWWGLPADLRPRNPDQHEPATDFDMRDLTAPREVA